MPSPPGPERGLKVITENSCLDFLRGSDDPCVETGFFLEDTHTNTHRQRERQRDRERASISWLHMRDSCRFPIMSRTAWGRATVVFVPLL